MDFEKKHVTNIYNIIGEHFDTTRSYIWKCVIDFMKLIPKNSILLEIGCGNGKHLKYRNDILSLGLDNSEKMIEICHNKKLPIIKADIHNLPFRDNSIDNIICVAVLHHLKGKSQQKKAIQNMIRICCDNGLILITVWDTSIVLKKKKSHIKCLANNEYLIGYKMSDLNTIHYRYYNLFNKQSILDRIEGMVDIITLIKIYNSCNNLVLILKKKKINF
jgi:SAM-dependent methyltransferase